MSDSECKAEIENALFWVGEIGGSDYARTFGSSISHELLTKLTLGQISKIVKVIFRHTFDGFQYFECIRPYLVSYQQLRTIVNLIPYLHDSHCWTTVQSTLWFKGYRHWDAVR